MTPLIRWIFIVAVLCSFKAVYAELDSNEQNRLFNEANRFFQDGNQASTKDPETAQAHYEKAILRFERLINEGNIVNGKLYYNLGNAYFLSGDVGRAMLNYLRAKQYLPNDLNLRQNLDYARKQRLDRVDETQQKRVLKTIFFWHYDLSPRVRMILFACCYLSLWLVAGLRLIKRHTALHWMIGLTGLGSIALFSSVNLEAYALAKNATGVVLSEEVVARKGNGETYQPSFEEPLHAGMEFEVLEHRQEWLHVKLPDQRQCWLPSAAIETVHPEVL